VTTEPASPSRPVPPELVALLEPVATLLEGKAVYGLPYRDLGAKHPFQLVTLGDCALFAAHEIPAGDHPDWVPFAILEQDPGFLVISTVSPYPVGMWVSENGSIYPVWEAFEVFVARAIDVRDRTPFEELEKTLDKVTRKLESRAHDDAIAILQPALDGLGTIPPEGRNDQLARAHRLYGRALQGVGRYVDARQAYDRAIAIGDAHARVHLIDLMARELGEPVVAIEHATSLRDTLDNAGRDLLSRYVAEAYLLTGEVAKAEAELRELLARTADKDAIRTTRRALEDYIEDEKPGADAVTAFLEWFKH
jgi:tetratricopeptide (TPR) repeat protein